MAVTDLSSSTTSTDAASTRTERPGTVAEVAALLRDTSGSVLVRGGATKLSWAGPVEAPELLLDTTSLRGVLTHNPADLTASVRAGTSLAELQDQLAGAGQWLALDAATGTVGATVGGLLAAGDSGPSRLRYGGLRDLVIGVTLVLADGKVARSGGHVIKNVAGYDLAKLVYGSLGSLAIITEVVVRLHPRVSASVTSAGPADAATATAATLALMASPLEPTAVEWVSDIGSSGEAGQLYVRTDGTPAFVSAADQRVRNLLAGLGVSGEPLTADDAAQCWDDHTRAVLGVEQETVLRVSGRPSEVGELVTNAARVARRTGLGLQVVSSIALGLTTVRLSGDQAGAHLEALDELRAEVHAAGASALLRQRHAGIAVGVDALGPPPSTVDLLRRIKAQFDPGGRLAPGRFRPWY